MNKKLLCSKYKQHIDKMSDLSRIRQKIELLRSIDADFKITGASSHLYRFNECLSEDELDEFEIRYEVSLPSGYSEFLSVLGNGGAGPYFGLFPLDEEPEEHMYNQFEYLSTKFPHTEKWEFSSELLDRIQDLIDNAKTKDDFFKYSWDEDVIDIYESLKEETKDDNNLQQFFEYVYDDVFNNICSDDVFSDDLTYGSILLSHNGSGLYYILVVSGTERGNVWIDARSDGGGIEPVLNEEGKHTDFLSWYEQWLDLSIEELKK